MVLTRRRLQAAFAVLPTLALAVAPFGCGTSNEENAFGDVPRYDPKADAEATKAEDPAFNGNAEVDPEEVAPDVYQ